jgi:hypothetical protein
MDAKQITSATTIQQANSGMTRAQRDRLVVESRVRARLAMPEFGDPIAELRKLMLTMFDPAFLDERGHAMIFDESWADDEGGDSRPARAVARDGVLIGF